MAEKTETPPPTPETKEPYVSDQLALRIWSVEARFLHEGTGIVTLHKSWDARNREFLIVPGYAGQDATALKPDVWTAWRHVLKPALGGHTYIRDFARVAESIPLHSSGALRLIDSEHALTMPEAVRRFESGSPGLVALVLRVHHLPRAYKLYNIAELEREGDFIPLPFDVELDDSTPAVGDAEFERRRRRILSALGKG